MAFLGVLIRGINHGVLIIVTSLAFKFAATSGLNTGVVSSLFTSAVIFIAIIFYCLYREKLYLKDFIGMAIIIAGVALISFGKPQSET